MMRGILFWFMLALAAIGATSVEDVVLKALEKNGRTVTLEFLSGPDRTAMVDLLRDIAFGRRHTFPIDEGASISADDLAAKIILLRIGDPAMMEKAVTEYRATHGAPGGFNRAEDLEWSQQGALIPLLATDFFKEDGENRAMKKYGREGVFSTPLSAYSGFLSLKIIAASEQFSPETRTWAQVRRNIGVEPIAKFREEMRVWWKQNETAFKAGDYKAVKPPAPVVPVALPDPGDSKRVLPAPPAPPAARSNPEPPAPETVPAPAPAAMKTEKPTPESPNWALWAGMMAVLAAAGGFLWLRSKTGR